MNGRKRKRSRSRSRSRSSLKNQIKYFKKELKIEEKEEEDKEIVGKSKLEIVIFLTFVSFNLSYKLFMSAIMNANLHTLLPVILASPHESSQIPLEQLSMFVFAFAVLQTLW